MAPKKNAAKAKAKAAAGSVDAGSPV